MKTGRNLYSDKEVQYLSELYTKHNYSIYKTAKIACKKLDRTYNAIVAKLYEMRKLGVLVSKVPYKTAAISTTPKLKKTYVITITIEER